jgi:hypothetical protein
MPGVNLAYVFVAGNIRMLVVADDADFAAEFGR